MRWPWWTLPVAVLVLLILVSALAQSQGKSVCDVQKYNPDFIGVCAAVDQ